MPIIDDENKRKQIVGMLNQAYWMEVETTMNYIANSINPDGVRAEEVKKSLGADVSDEIGHAQLFGKRIQELYGEVPGSFEFKPAQQTLQPPSDTTDIVSVIKGVIDAERGAIDFYKEILDACENADLVTQDMVIDILKDEERHLRLFEGFLKEYEKQPHPTA